MSNLNANNNIFSYMEQGMKVFEGQGQCVNCSIEYNDFNNIHRINFEIQANIGGSQPTSMFIRYNSIHDQYDTNYGAWGFSAAVVATQAASPTPTTTCSSTTCRPSTAGNIPQAPSRFGDRTAPRIITTLFRGTGPTASIPVLTVSLWRTTIPSAWQPEEAQQHREMGATLTTKMKILKRTRP